MFGQSSFSNSGCVVAVVLVLILYLAQATVSSMVQATFYGSLSSDSPIFIRPYSSGESHYYYQAFQVTVSIPGLYTFSSSSAMNTYGLFYNSSFDPSDPYQNLSIFDDDSGTDVQFLLTVYVSSASSYTLIVTTHNKNVMGSFSITASGPSSIDVTAFTQPTSTPITTTTAPFSILSTYIGDFLNPSPIFFPPDGNARLYYYKAIQVTVNVTGAYTFTSYSSMNTYGYFYHNTVDPSYPSQNLIKSDDGNPQFSLNVYLLSTSSYSLIVATDYTNASGRVAVIASGPSQVTLDEFTPSTGRPMTITTSAPTILSSYSGYLSSSDSVFDRPGGTTENYYFQALRVNIWTSGTYIFKSISSMDTYGYLYNDAVDPSYPSENLITSDDEGGGDRQFRISVNLTSGSSYVLLCTTFHVNVTGSFSITASGPSSIDLTAFTPSTRRPIRTTSATATTVLSTYSGLLSTGSPMFSRPNSNGEDYYYYQAVRVAVSVTGTYNFTSSSSFMYHHGYIYYDPFDPSYADRNMFYTDYGAGIGRFPLTVHLSSGSSYVLVVTTDSPGTVGSFYITVSGPSSIDLAAFTPSSSTTTSTTGSFLIISTYAGALSSASSLFNRPGVTSGDYYYQALRVNIYNNGTYIFKSNSTMDTYGYLYNNTVDLSSPSENLITSDDDGGGGGQFRIVVSQNSGSSYVLLCTTYRANAMGSFSITVEGPSMVYFASFMPSATPCGIDSLCKHKNGLETPAIIGIIVGCVVLALSALLFLVYFRVHQRRSTANYRRLAIEFDPSRHASDVNPFSRDINHTTPREDENETSYSVPTVSTAPDAPPPAYESLSQPPELLTDSIVRLV